MPDPWMTGLIRDPRDPGNPYPVARTRMQFAVHHDTAGTNSYSICKYGRAGYNNSLCNVLLPKIGAPWQFAPIDSLTYHAGSAQYGDYNGFGPGFEVERLSHDEPLSEDQFFWLGRIGVWLATEWDLPNLQYRGAHGGAIGWRGHVNHSDLHPNPDGLTFAEWDAIIAGVGTGPAPTLTQGDKMIAVVHIEGHTDLFTVALDNKVWWKHDNNTPSVLTVNGNAKFPEITVDGLNIFLRGPDKGNGEPQFVKGSAGAYGWTAAWA